MRECKCTLHVAFRDTVRSGDEFLRRFGGHFALEAHDFVRDVAIPIDRPPRWAAASATVRFSRGVWIVDASDTVLVDDKMKRKRTIKTFGAGRLAKAAAGAYRDEIAPHAKAGKHFERLTATFRDLWERLEASELVGTDPGPATVADYKAIARLCICCPRWATRCSPISTPTI